MAGLFPPNTIRQTPADEDEPKPSMNAVEIVVDGPGAQQVVANDNGVVEIETDDGGVVIDMSGGFGRAKDKGGAQEHNANLAEFLPMGALNKVAEDLLTGIQLDEQSRRDWLETRAQGLRLLGLKIYPPRSNVDTSAALEGMSNVIHPLLLESVLRFQANARGELLPSDGPVKVEDKLTDQGEIDDEAQGLEDDLNYYLTVGAPEYYPDTDRALFMTGFGGCSFKKVFFDPIRQRPVSESIDAKDLIVSDASTDLRNSSRVTHQIKMRPALMRRMQQVGAYLDVPLSTPSYSDTNPVDLQIAEIQGVNAQTQQMTEDRDHTVYESYCEIDLPGFEDEEDGERTGIPLPYRVVVEKDSRRVLEVRRNWAEGDERKLMKSCFIKYPFVPGLGFYDIGLVHILGNTTNALTAAWREMLDAGMFSNFPGFLYAKSMGHQNTNEFRVPPGGGAPIDTMGMPIQEAVMPLPYKDVSTAFDGFIEKIAEVGQRLGGTAEVQIAEGRQDAPVGTTLALIEQATKVVGAVHKRLHAAQAEEFQLLKELFREHPESFIRVLKARGGAMRWNVESFLLALNDASIVPQADPNTPSHMHRLMKAMALIQLDQAYPGIMKPEEIVKRVARTIGENLDGLLADPNQGQGVPPEIQAKLAELADKDKERQSKLQLAGIKGQQDAQSDQRAAQLQAAESRDQAADRQARQNEANMALQGDALEAKTDLQSDLLKGKMALELEREKQQTEEIKGRHVAKAENAKAKTEGAKTATETAKAKTEAVKAKTVAAKARTAAKKPAAKKT